MGTYTYAVTQEVWYYREMEADSPKDIVEMIESDTDWDHEDNEVKRDRVQVFDDAGNLVFDTDPADCTECGRSDHAGFRDGEPYCHRHLGEEDDDAQG